MSQGEGTVVVERSLRALDTLSPGPEQVAAAERAVALADEHGTPNQQIQARINLIKSKLSKANIIDPSTLPKDQVSFGATVVVKDVDLGDEEEYTLVGSGEEDYNCGRILVTSPLGQGLLGKKIGETATIPAPKGSYDLEIVAIRFDFLE